MSCPSITIVENQKQGRSLNLRLSVSHLWCHRWKRQQECAVGSREPTFILPGWSGDGRWWQCPGTGWLSSDGHCPMSQGSRSGSRTAGPDLNSEHHHMCQDVFSWSICPWSAIAEATVSRTASALLRTETGMLPALHLVSPPSPPLPTHFLPFPSSCKPKNPIATIGMNLQTEPD